jgi:hypothetical protein
MGTFEPLRRNSRDYPNGQLDEKRQGSQYCAPTWGNLLFAHTAD